MQNATKKSESAASEPTPRKPVPVAKKAKLSVLLISGDDTLWPQIGAHVGGDLLLKQVDSIDELLTATTSGQPAIVLWDARNQTDAAGVLSRMQLHSPRRQCVDEPHCTSTSRGSCGSADSGRQFEGCPRERA